MPTENLGMQDSIVPKGRKKISRRDELLDELLREYGVLSRLGVDSEVSEKPLCFGEDQAANRSRPRFFSRFSAGV